MKRNATAVWNGTIKEGKGHLTSQSGVLTKTPYTFVSRFENGTDTNPEELMAAAHAGCFTMKLSAELTSAGYNPEELTTTASITLENGVITKSDLVLTAKIKGITEEEFQRIAKLAEETCPVSNAYKLEITLNATLI
ncbi:OsmC family peroxiredoxin [Flavobacterium amniphilum]|uniref:OsmC family peroxiredoxin n=1 Tax=Flavobacterium amniphilum TaxID=1834035 RepID=UPI002029C2B2|nr:OsmC family peroxiredoxin [Flavobacterium amniphilum]MCL9806971.1 OsmC family peroxiredoxin [Flavobacterium amniphilum]